MELNKENLYNEYVVKNKTQEECTKVFDISIYYLKKALTQYGINKEQNEDYYFQKYSKEVKDFLGEEYELKQLLKDTNKLLIRHKACGKDFLLSKKHIRESVGCLICFKEKNKEISDEEFKKYYLKGYSSTEMKELFGISKDKFHHWAKRLNLKMTPENRQKIQMRANLKGAKKRKKIYFNREDIINLVDNGASEKDISKIYGCTKSTVNKYIIDNNLGIYKNKNLILENTLKKTKETCLKKYGVKNVMDVQEFREKAILNKPDIHVSKPEIELREYVQSIYPGEVIRTNDGTYELDIYIPDKKVGIEYNGNYWHSLKNREKNYHYNKSKHFEEKGIRVIHIWEYEWNNPRQRPILENIIKNALGLNDKTIYARKCKIEVRPSASMKDFFQKNNIQGFRGGKFAICLVYENEVVMAYMMGHCFFGKGKYEWEVIRGATKLGYNVVGGASKIWNYFLTEYNPTNCVYYIDYNYFNGNSLPYLGLTYIKSQAGFKNWWVKTNEVKNREPLRHKEIMRLQALGEVIPIYNAGTKVYVWENNNIKSGNKKNEG